MDAKQQLHQARLNKWASLIQEQQSSNLTVKDWCTKNNLSYHAYNYWKHLIKEEYINSLLPEIVPLEVSPNLSDGVSDSCDAAPALRESRDLRNSCDTNSCNSHDIHEAKTISLSIGDISINIGPATSDQMLFNIIKAVRYA